MIENESKPFWCLFAKDRINLYRHNQGRWGSNVCPVWQQFVILLWLVTRSKQPITCRDQQQLHIWSSLSKQLTQKLSGFIDSLKYLAGPCLLARRVIHGEWLG